MWARDAAEGMVSEGEILVARSNTPHLVGRVSMFEGEPKGAVASDLTIRILPHTDMCPRFVAAYLSFLYLSGYWRERAGGASGSMKKITRKQILEIPIHVPTLQEQMRIASELSERMSGVKVLRKAVHDQLDALKKMPAALLRCTFNGGGRSDLTSHNVSQTV
jgi:type I restriction enzyme S subunit